MGTYWWPLAPRYVVDFITLHRMNDFIILPLFFTERVCQTSSLRYINVLYQESKQKNYFTHMGFENSSAKQMIGVRLFPQGHARKHKRDTVLIKLR